MRTQEEILERIEVIRDSDMLGFGREVVLGDEALLARYQSTRYNHYGKLHLTIVCTRGDQAAKEAGDVRAS